MKQVITFSPDGSVSGLQRKPGQGIDLTKFGKADVKRVSEIVWDTDHQAWKIDVLQDAGKGIVTCVKLTVYGVFVHQVIGLLGYKFSNLTDELGGRPVLFDNYDDAVKVEIAYLDALRVEGQH